MSKEFIKCITRVFGITSFFPRKNMTTQDSYSNDIPVAMQNTDLDFYVFYVIYNVITPRFLLYQRMQFIFSSAFLTSLTIPYFK